MEQTQRIFRLLKKRKKRIVFAESCTGGELAGQLSRVPRISDHLCGSFVVYREDSKMRWLGVKASTLKKHSAVSEACANEMHAGALRNTPEAHYAVSVTGYLGPGNPDDGLVYVTIGTRAKKQTLKLKLLQHSKKSPSLRQRRRALLVRKIWSQLAAFIQKNP